MKCVFTLCSNNYLAKAKTLGDSVVRHNPGYQFMIGLVDRLSADVDYTFFSPHQIVPIEAIGLEGFDNLWQKYNVTELNTAVKPFFFGYIFRQHPDIESAIYLDPDILVLCDFGGIERELSESAIVITPHALSPIGNDGHRPQERNFLKHGIYNLGFIAIAAKPEIHAFLNWWAEHTYHDGFCDPKAGLFVDQLWMNLAPVYFDVKASRNIGLNVAYWNLHERKLSTMEGVPMVNDHARLVFFHFSGYSPSNPAAISVHQTRYTFETRPDLVDLFSTYRQLLFTNGHSRYSAQVCYYAIERSRSDERAAKTRSDWLQAGIIAYRRGDTRAARRHLLAAIWRNPLVLRDKRVLSRCVESFVGSKSMGVLRSTRRRLASLFV